MTRTQARRLLPLGFVAAGAIGAAASFAVGATRLGAVVACLLVGAVGAVGLDVRSRLGDVAHMLRLSAGRQKDIALSARNAARATESLVAAVRSAEGDGGRVEQMERRLLASFEAERLRAADRHREASAGLSGVVEASVRDVVDPATDRLLSEVASVGWTQSQSVEALLQLLPRIEPRAPLPALGNWALDGQSMLHLVDLIERERPKLVVELGSGTSTIWLGYLLERTGGRLVSIEHDERYAEVTAESVARHGLEDVVELRVAPLEDVDVDGSTYRWYSVDVFDDLEGIDVLVVDGPPKSTGRSARFPALPILIERLSKDARVVLDDSNRPEERRIFDRWLAGHPSRSEVPRSPSRLAVLQLGQS